MEKELNFCEAVKEMEAGKICICESNEYCIKENILLFYHPIDKMWLFGEGTPVWYANKKWKVKVQHLQPDEKNKIIERLGSMNRLFDSMQKTLDNQKRVLEEIQDKLR